MSTIEQSLRSAKDVCYFKQAIITIYDEYVAFRGSKGYIFIKVVFPSTAKLDITFQATANLSLVTSNKVVIVSLPSAYNGKFHVNEQPSLSNTKPLILSCNFD